MAGSKQVLVVDDDKDVLDIVSGYVKSNGYTVITSSDGEDAMHKLVTRSIDMVITDARMPVATGADLVSVMRQNGFDQPVIVVTAYEEDPNILALFKRNLIYKILSKPIDPNIFAITLEGMERIRDQQLVRVAASRRIIRKNQ